MAFASLTGHSHSRGYPALSRHTYVLTVLTPLAIGSYIVSSCNAETHRTLSISLNNIYAQYLLRICNAALICWEVHTVRAMKLNTLRYSLPLITITVIFKEVRCISIPMRTHMRISKIDVSTVEYNPITPCRHSDI